MAAAGVRGVSVSAISSIGSRPFWRAVRITLIVTTWVRAPFQVRFPPQLLRLTIAWSERLLREPVRRLHAGLLEEREHVLALGL